MDAVSECPFCHCRSSGSSELAGTSVECPRCVSFFTFTPIEGAKLGPPESVLLSHRFAGAASERAGSHTRLRHCVGRAACPKCASQLNIVQAKQVAIRPAQVAQVVPAELAPAVAAAAPERTRPPVQIVARTAPRPAAAETRLAHQETRTTTPPVAAQPAKAPQAAPAHAPRRRTDPELDSFEFVPPLWWPLASVVVISATPVCAAISSLAVLALPLCIVGLLSGLVCLGAAALAQERRKVSAAVTAYAALMLLMLALRPATFGPTYYAYRQPLPNLDQVTVIAKAGQPASALPKNAEWVDASKFRLTRNNVQLEVVGATVSRIEVRTKSGTRRLTDEPYLVLSIRRQNIGDPGEYAANIRKPGVPKSAPLMGSVTDENGASYAQQDFDLGTERSGTAVPVQVFPGSITDDLMVFKAPPRDVSQLRLELSATDLGPASLRFTLPAAMIAWR